MSIPPRVSAAVPGRLSVHRSPKRQRLGHFYDSSSSSDEEEAGIAEAVGATRLATIVRRSATISNDSSSSSDEEEEEVGIAEAASVTRTRTAGIVSDSTSSSDEEDDLLIVRLANVQRTAAIANNSGNVTRSVNNTPEASSSSSSPQSVKLKSSDVLDCPTCCEPLKKPIYQCSNGHLACSPCVTKLWNRCPFCKSHIGDIRCRAMEKIIETSIVSCRNAVYGCQETSTYGNQSSSHEKLCGYIPCSCPLPDCDYTGSYTDLKSHARSSHCWGKDNHVQFTLDKPILFNLNLLGKEKVTVLREKNDGDLIVVRGFERSNGLYVTVGCMSPKTPPGPGTCSYSCSLARLDSHTSLRIGMMVKKIQKVDEQEEEPRDGFLLIPSYMFSDYVNCCQLKLQICIGRERKYVHI